MSNRNWTREETMLAFELYCIIPSGKDTTNNPSIIELAKAINRTPSSVKLKLQNFKSCDPSYTSRGKVGLANVSRLDKEVCAEFLGQWDEMLLAVDEIKSQMNIEKAETEVNKDTILQEKLLVATDKEAMRKVRVGHVFFSRAVRSAYENRCCITGISIPELLRASHIKPWRDSNDVNEKANPRNGLLLNALHDVAFDKGYISIDNDYRIILSNKLENFTLANRKYFYAHNGVMISLPSRFLPDVEFIKYHNDVIFKR